MSDLRTILTGVVFGESPRWHDDRLWFSDWARQEIHAVDADGDNHVVVTGPDSGFAPACIDFLPDGRLLLVSGRRRALLTREADDSFTRYADLSEAHPHENWNEVVVDGRGDAYVNNIAFTFPGGEFAPGIIALVTPDGSARQVADGIAFPNGMALTPDDSTLIVAESYGQRLTAFDIGPDGDLSNRRVWADLPGAAPDGICLDAEGAAWYADVPHRSCVRVREGGDVVQRFDLELGCFSCALGGTDGRRLFLVVQDYSDPAGMLTGPPTGQILAVDVPVPAA